jgi:hypothetical protein
MARRRGLCRARRGSARMAPDQRLDHEYTDYAARPVSGRWSSGRLGAEPGARPEESASPGTDHHRSARRELHRFRRAVAGPALGQSGIGRSAYRLERGRKCEPRHSARPDEPTSQTFVRVVAWRERNTTGRRSSVDMRVAPSPRTRCLNQIRSTTPTSGTSSTAVRTARPTLRRGCRERRR